MGVRVAKPSNEKKQRVRPRRKRARARVSRDETKYRLPRAHLAHLCHRHRISRGLSLRDPSDLSLHRPFATDAVASCKLKVDPKTPPPPFRMARRVRCVRDRSNRALSPRSDLKGLPDRPVRFSRPSSPHPARTRAMTGSARGGGVSTKIFFNIRFWSVPVSDEETTGRICVCSLKKGKRSLHFSVTVHPLNARAHSRANFFTRHATSARRCRSFEVVKSRTGRNFR